MLSGVLSLKPYCPENKIPLLSMKDFSRLQHFNVVNIENVVNVVNIEKLNFSKILLKTDNKEIGR